MSKFTYSERTDGTEIFVALAGSMNETTAFPRTDFSDFTSVNIDLRDVLDINSLGIATWIGWVKNLASHPNVSFHRCPYAVVMQFNTVRGFLPPNAKVASFYLPFHCEKCGKSASELVNPNRDLHLFGPSPALKTALETKVRCENSSCLMACDVTPAKYLAFLKPST